MEELLMQIEKLHRFCIWCLAGMTAFGIISVILFQKLEIKKVIGFLKRHHKKKLWMLLLCVGVLAFGNMEAMGAVKEAEEEITDELAPKLTLDIYGAAEAPVAFNTDRSQTEPYMNASETISIKIYAEDEAFDAEKSYVKIRREDFCGEMLSEELFQFEQKGEELIYWTDTEATEDGHYTAEIYAVDQTGNIAKQFVSFGLDHAAPEIEEIYCTNEQGERISFFEHQETYRHFSKEKIYVHIKARDLASGVKSITYLYEHTNTEAEEAYQIKTEEMTGEELVAELPYSFKGTFSVWATDHLGQTNQSPTVTGMIAESEETHLETSEASLKILTKHSKTPGYYKTDVDLVYKTRDSYSGIGLIAYTAGEWQEEADYRRETKLCTEELLKEYTLEAAEYQQNNILTGLEFLDLAGHKVTLSEKELPVIHIDSVKPKVEVEYDNQDAQNERYYREKRTASVYVTERNFDPEDVYFDLEGPKAEIGEWVHSAGAGCEGSADPKHTGHTDACVWKCQVIFAEDGDYRFGFSCVDLAGNEGSYGHTDEFVIDQTEPKITVSYHGCQPQNGIYYQDIRTATIEIEERNFSASLAELEIFASSHGVQIENPVVSQWSNVGDRHYAVITYDCDGEYTFDISCTDLAGNEASDYMRDHFIIDLTKPEITFSGVRDRSANRGEIALMLQVSDTNYDKSQTETILIGWNRGEVDFESAKADTYGGEVIRLKDFSYEKEQDDLYRLIVSATDLAGNQSEESLTFSVNRFGSVFDYDIATENLLKAYYTDEAPIPVLTETNVDTVLHREIVCNHDGKLRTLKDGIDYTISISGDESSWKQYRYEIKQKNFREDGHYAITIYSQDRAENTSNNLTQGKTLEFAVDRKAPMIVMSGVEDQERYREHSRKAEIQVQDNVTLSEAVVELNGRRLSFSAEELEKTQGKIVLTIESEDDWQTLQIKAKDMAGNTAESETVTFLITPNLWVQFWQITRSFLHKILSFPLF